MDPAIFELKFSVCHQMRAAFELSWHDLICGDSLFGLLVYVI